MRNLVHKPAPWVFLILFGSFAFFWHSRDWNTASRLMLTYALVDRGTVTITGLEVHTEDKARFHGDYYSDKLPGFAFLGSVPYAVSRLVFRMPPHPLNEAVARAHWAADYWVTLFTSGLFTALTGALVVYSRVPGLYGRAGGLTRTGLRALNPGLRLCDPRLWPPGHRLRPLRFVFPGLEKVLAPPAGSRVPRGLSRGHGGGGRAECRTGLGDCRPLSSVQCLRRERRFDDLALFGVGAVIPTLLLLGYNQLAFGSPWEMGYFHHANAPICRGAQHRNPLGLVFPESFWGRLASLLWGGHRGLLLYAPIVLLAVPGWFALFARRCFSGRSSRSSSWEQSCWSTCVIRSGPAAGRPGRGCSCRSCRSRFFPLGGCSRAIRHSRKLRRGPRLHLPSLAVQKCSCSRESAAGFRRISPSRLLKPSGRSGREHLYRSGIRTSDSARTSRSSLHRSGLHVARSAGKESSSCRC